MLFHYSPDCATRTKTLRVLISGLGFAGPDFQRLDARSLNGITFTNHASNSYYTNLTVHILVTRTESLTRIPQTQNP